MDMRVKAGVLYGVEICVWKRRGLIERVQSKFVKTSAGLPRTTPDYTWKMETGRREIEVEVLRINANF